VDSVDTIISQLNTHHWKPERGQTAVLLIDLQEYFRRIITPVLQNFTKVIAAARKQNMPLFFTQHGHGPQNTQGMLGKWWVDLIMEGSREAQLIPELDVKEGDVVIPKTTYSAFFRTDLEKRLMDQDIKDLVIGGVMTNLCCETTARDAFIRDFRVFFLADGTSTVSEDFHLASLKNLAYGFAVLLTCEGFIASISP
jgi:nicotinamidase-related amidase